MDPTVEEVITNQQETSPVSVPPPPQPVPTVRSDIWRDVFLWRRRDLSLMVLGLVTVTWVLLDVYQFNLITILSWLAIAVIALLFLVGNTLRLLGKQPLELSRLEISELTTIEIANACRGAAEEVIRLMFRVSAEGEWYLFLQVVAGLLFLSYVGTFTDLITLVYIGTVLGLTVPVIYVKYEDRIKRTGDQMKERSKGFYEMVDKKVKNKVVSNQKDKKLE